MEHLKNLKELTFSGFQELSKNPINYIYNSTKNIIKDYYDVVISIYSGLELGLLGFYPSIISSASSYYLESKESYMVRIGRDLFTWMSAYSFRDDSLICGFSYATVSIGLEILRRNVKRNAPSEPRSVIKLMKDQKKRINKKTKDL